MYKNYQLSDCIQMKYIFNSYKNYGQNASKKGQKLHLNT